MAIEEESLFALPPKPCRGKRAPGPHSLPHPVSLITSQVDVVVSSFGASFLARWRLPPPFSPLCSKNY